MTTPFPFTQGQVLTAAQMNAITELVVNDKTASYTLVAGDAGERVIMNSASATTITVNTSVFTAGQLCYITNKGAGVCTITAGTATVSSTGSLALAQFASGVLYCISAGVFLFEAYGVSATSITASTATVATAQTTTSATFTDLATAGPAVTLTTGTQVLVLCNSKLSTPNANEAYFDFAISGATTRAAAFTTDAYLRVQSSDSQGRFGNSNLMTVTAGSNTFTMKYASGGSSVTFTDRTIIVVAL